MNKTYTINPETATLINELTAELRAQGDRALALLVRKVYGNIKNKEFTSTNTPNLLASFTGKKLTKDQAIVAIEEMLPVLIFDEVETLIETNEVVETPVKETVLVELTQTEKALQSNNRKVVKKAIKATDDAEELKALKKHLKVLKVKDTEVNTLEDASKVVLTIVDGDIVREERNFSLTRLGKGKAWSQFHNDNREIVISVLAAIKWQKLRETMTVTKTKEFQEAGEVLVHSYADPKYASAFEVLSKLIEVNSGAADDENFMEVYSNQENWYENCMSELELTKEQRLVQLAKRCLYTHEKLHGDISKKDVSKTEYKAIEMVRDYRKPIKAF